MERLSHIHPDAAVRVRATCRGTERDLGVLVEKSQIVVQQPWEPKEDVHSAAHVEDREGGGLRQCAEEEVDCQGALRGAGGPVRLAHHRGVLRSRGLPRLGPASCQAGRHEVVRGAAIQQYEDPTA